MPKTLKEWKNFDEQLFRLKERGLIIDDEAKALGYLKTIGYYRLSGYLYPFRQSDTCNSKVKLDNFIDNTHFSDIKQLYTVMEQFQCLIIFRKYITEDQYRFF